VPAQAGDPLPPERLLDAPADDHVGDHGEEDGDEQGAEQHQADGRGLQPRRLAPEGVVAVADRRHGLDGEVDGAQQRQRPRAGHLIGEVKHRGRRDQHEQQGGQGRRHPPVGRRPHQRHDQEVDALRRAVRPGVSGIADLRAHSGRAEFLRRREQRHPVAFRHRVVPAGADDHVASAGGQDRHRGQRPVQVPQAGRPRRRRSRNEEPLTVEHDLLRARLEARFRDGRGRQSGHVQHRDLDLGQGPAHGRVGQLDDHAHVGAQLAGQQDRLQRVQVVLEDADERGRAGQPGLGQRRGRPGTARDQRNAPPGELPDQPHVRVVVHDHRRDAGEVQLLDDTQADTVQAAHDHVPAPVRVPARHPGIIKLVYDGDVSRAYAPHDDCASGCHGPASVG
jgi:hypothetical protein